MRKVLFAAVALVMLLSLFAGSAVAAEPKRTDAISAQLGEVWGFYFGGYLPYERVDAYMYRPSTVGGWPFVDPPVVGTWWWTGGESMFRRQSYPDWQYADNFGYYFTMFMLPRDEVWFPCSYPLKWKCNYEVAPGVVEYHSPATQPFEAGMVWPWAVNPMDTISPLEVWLYGETGTAWIIEFEVTGYYWKWSDIP